MQGDRRGILFLAAEPSAGRRLDHAQARLVPAERFAQRLQDVVGTLHRAAHDEDVPFECRDHPLWLEIKVLLSSRFVRPFDHDRRSGEGALHVALRNAQVFEDVVGSVLDLIGPRRHTEVEHRGLRSDLDSNRRRGAPQGGTVGVSQQHDRLVDVPNVPGSQHGLIGLDQRDDVGPWDIPVIHDREL